MSLFWLGQDRQILQPLFFLFRARFLLARKGWIWCDIEVDSTKFNSAWNLYLFIYVQTNQ